MVAGAGAIGSPGLLIVQPWFTAIGHPAQSVLNTARVLGRRPDVAYVISRLRGGDDFDESAHELEQWGPVNVASVPSNSLPIGTACVIGALARRLRAYYRGSSILFLDSHLAVLGALAPLLPRARRLSAIQLSGPERICSHPLKRWLARQFLARPERRLFLRTEELATAWREALTEVPPDRIDTIPSLEIPDQDETVSIRGGAGPMRFGLIGQVRPGKSLEWLVPLFRAHPELGILHLAGAFANDDHRRRLAFLDGYAEFENRFLSEQEMLAKAAAQDYLVVLYDDWDTRMEAATVYIAARVGRPVIVYDEGWCGRMVREYGCGIAVPRSLRPGIEFFRALPHREDGTYQTLVAGMARFRAAHSGDARRAEFMRKVTGKGG